MQLSDVVAGAATETATVVRGVKPDQLDLPTPCRDWPVRTLANHLMQVVAALEAAGRGGPVPGDLWQSDRMAGDWAARFDEEARRAVDAWSSPSAPTGAVDVGGAAMPAPMVATMLASDLVVHGWDLARATGQDLRSSPAVAELTLGFVADTAEQGRTMGLFGPPVPVAADAPPLERALALSGRDPAWRPPGA
jgi:uncharacterized protein (TIGR03086 family)